MDEKNIPIELYSPMQIVVITYIATPMAGSILLAISFGRLGKSVSAKRALILGGISTVALAVLGFFTPPNLPKIIVYFLPIFHTLIMNWAVRKTYKEDYDTPRMGGRGSNWHVAGIGVLCLAGFFFVRLLVNYILSLFISYPPIEIP